MPGTLEERMLQSAKVADLAAAELRRRVEEAFGLPKVVVAPWIREGETAQRHENRKSDLARAQPSIEPVESSVMAIEDVVRLSAGPLMVKPASVVDAWLRRLIVGVYATAGLFTGMGAYLLRDVAVSPLVCSAGAGVPFVACVIWVALERRRRPQRPQVLLFHATIALLVAFIVVALIMICVALVRRLIAP